MAETVARVRATGVTVIGGNALDRARLRQANRIFREAMAGKATVSATQLSTITSEDIRASRVFDGGLRQS